MKVLLLASRDSSNVTYANLYKALCRRGHKCFITVLDMDDELNNKVFNIDAIPYYPKDILTSIFLDEIDIAFVPPFGAVAYKRVREILTKKKKFVLSFSVLYSAVSVRSDCDMILSINQNKFAEFGTFGMWPRILSIGDPRYDTLIQLRQERERSNVRQEIKKVLIIDGGVYPYGYAGQKQVSDTLKNIAKNNPQLSFEIKLRFLPNERGVRNHAGSVYLYDFFDEMPPNLTWIDHPTILEEIIADYDAVILEWSSAFYAVVALGLPVIFMEGFRSDDVFDVRAQRVQLAYDYLRASGCVKHYTELLDHKIEFCLPNLDWARAQLENYDDGPCSDRYVDLLELLYQEMHQEDLRFISSFQLSYNEFVKKLSELPKVNKYTNEYKIAHSYYSRLNNKLQKFTYENRCLAAKMDTSILGAMYDQCDQLGTDPQLANGILQEVDDTLNQKTAELFSSLDVERDRIWWFYYFRYLYLQKDDKQLMEKQESLCVEGQYYYQALSCFRKKQKIRAAKYLLKYIRTYIEKRNQGVCDTPIMRDLTVPESSLLHYEIFRRLYRGREYEMIEYLFFHNRNTFRLEVVIYFMMKVYLKQKKSINDIYLIYNLRRSLWKKKTGTWGGNLLLNRLERKIDYMGKRA